MGRISKEDTVQYALSIAWAYWVLCPTCLAFLPREKDWKQEWWQHMCFEEFTIFILLIYFLFSFFWQKIKPCDVWTELWKIETLYMVWGTTCWKSACLIRDTGVTFSRHWCCLFISACYYMGRLFWSGHDWAGAAVHWVRLLWGCCCFIRCFWVQCAEIRCKARIALDNSSVPCAQLEHSQHRVEQSLGMKML